MTPLLEATEATFRYPGRARAVGPLSLAVHAGELHYVRGPSGSGKSTCARMLTGLIPHLYRGELSGAVCAGADRTVDIPLWQVSVRVGLVGQNPPAQLLAATVGDEIVFGLENLGLSRVDVQARLDAVLDRFGLRSLGRRDPRTLSGGEQQKLVFAAVAARRPPVLVLDEAFSMLDTAAVSEIAEYVQCLRRDGTAIVVFAHVLPTDAWLPPTGCRVLPSTAPAEPPVPDFPVRIDPFRIDVRGLGVTLGDRRVLDGIDLSLAGGQVVSVHGANGAGKTTLLRALAGLQRYTGRIEVDHSGAPRLGLCFQNADQQIFNASVREEILYGNAGVDMRLYHSVVALLGLEPYERTPPLLLSEGEKKRLALAILLTRPGLRGVCLDEPTLGQDDEHRRRIGRVVRHLAAAGYLCVVATHDLEWTAEWCDHSVLLQAGRVVRHQDAPAAPRAYEREATEEQCQATV